MNAQIKIASVNTEENMNLWNQVFITDPLAVKPITGKAYKGSSPKPYWLIEQATRVFGPAGYGWGHDIINQGFQQCGPEDMIHWAIVEFWYMKGDQRCAVQQMGGTKAMYKTNNGKMIVDEDAPKKSVTDALVKAMSSIGFAGDIFSGRWDDSKYQQEAYDHHHNPQPTDADFHSALKHIELAANRKALGEIYKRFVGTQYQKEIEAQCGAKSDKEGWSA